MDNASKALIIAGAILIAVMLVSLGVMLYNTASGVAEGTIGTVEALGVEGFNAQFNQYMGSGKKASVTQGLIDKVIANNANGETTISVTYNGTTASTSTALTNIRNSITSKDVTYTIAATNYDTTGVITAITITKVNR